MTREPDRDRDLASRLLAEEAAPRGAESSLSRLLDMERDFERRVRRAALVSWAATFGTLPLLGLGLFIEISAESEHGPATSAVRAAVIALLVLGSLSLLVALLTTLAWLFRARTASLAAIERRLADLEQILRSRAE